MCVLAVGLSTPSHAQVFQVVSGKLDSDDNVFVAPESGATIRLSKGITLKAWPGSRLHRVHKRVKLWLSAEGRTLTHVIALAGGRVDIECNDPTRAVLVRAPLEIASVVRGGHMSLSAQDGQVSIVNQDSTVIWALGAGKFTKLEAGKIKTLSKFAESETALLSATEVRMENNLYGGFGKGAELTGVDWQPVPQAVGYRVSIQQLEPENRALGLIETVGPVLSPPPQLPAGRYALSVHAVDRFGIEGRASQPQSFSVVGVRTSDGGYVDQRGNIVAGYDRRLRLTFAEGLVMKGGALDWQPVPEEIILPSSDPMDIHVRQAGDTRLLSARVVSHQVKTTVSVGPKLVRWPGESVQIEVSITGPNGEGIPAWIEPQFRVLLGIDEVEVAWRREGDRYVTEVPAREGDGPWVVRAEVSDQFGHALGRDFVEVAPRELAPLPVAAPPPAAPKPPAQASR